MKRNLIAINEPVWVELNLVEEIEVDFLKQTDEELLNDPEYDIFLMDKFVLDSSDELKDHLERQFNRYF